MSYRNEKYFKGIQQTIIEDIKRSIVGISGSQIIA